jgi:hypothetical protein
VTATRLDEFTRAYIECALWSSTDDAGEPLDDTYIEDDIAPAALADMAEDCRQFQADNAELLAQYRDAIDVPHDSMRERRDRAALCAGHDFWLTRNGHGAGFWDRGLGEIGDKLSQAARAWGSSDLYVGDDGKIYVS